MKALAIFPKPSEPLTSGDAIRNHHLLRALTVAGHSVDVATMRHPGEVMPSWAAYDIPLSLGDALHGRYRAILGGRPYQASVARHPAFREAMRRIDVKAYDRVIYSQLFTATAQLDLQHPAAIFDTHNHEASRVAKLLQDKPLPVRLLAQRSLASLSRLEDAVSGACRDVVACSDTDAARFTTACSVVANGVDGALLQRRSREKMHDVLFLGSLSYSANVDALEYLLRRVVPRLDGRVSIAVAGSGASSGLARRMARTPRIRWLGEVASSAETMQEARVLVVPLRHGGGTRLKILEALAVGTPVLTTSAGAEGLRVDDGVHLLVRDDDQTLAEGLSRLLRDGALAALLRRNGQELVRRHYTWRAIGEHWVRVVEAEGTT